MKSSIALVLGALAATATAIPTQQHQPTPDTVVIQGWRLEAAKAKIAHGDETYTKALGHLTAQADSWLGQGPWTVTSKDKAPPSGDKHDYASQAPYYWPNPNTTDGCPYINRDGERNPEVDKYTDRLGVGKMFNSSYVLSLAWYYTEKEEYAMHAVDILRTWFVTPETAMNPNLNHAQIIPCANTGRAIGIIDFSQEYTNVLDAVSILSTSPKSGWTEADDAAFRDWNKRFLTWLTESKFGLEEAKQSNNHGTFANMQVSAIALFLGNETLAKSTVEKAKTFIKNQISADGFQPQETKRTRSWHYTHFNLGAHLRWALIADKVDVDLFHYKGPKGQSLFKAVNVTVDAAVNGPSDWPFEDLEFKKYTATDNIHGAAQAGLCSAKKALPSLQPPPGGDIFILRPAPQQLDSIVTL
ncbi:hypothetical protein VHEMI05439 [[Torrubiella] hemipterigena]|uniref:Alginate lyase domain-containing protein n=1 Tax=[Torrubiella] hemipterigena TaxID=1531966 RepID=A0A0A1T464_9HYPO|nr:hypothetical protein VHEMI05439 [[Torrubiella] hemipterigena]